MPEARALSAWLSFALSGCAQEHLSIGGRWAVDADVPQLDASMVRIDASTLPRDASPRIADGGLDSEDDGNGLAYGSFRALGFDDIVSLSGGCGAGCVDIELTAHGGTPPYDFVWFDGVRGPERRFCDDGGVELQTPLGMVTDSRQWSTTIFGSAYVEQCRIDAPATMSPEWNVCYTAVPVFPDCGELRDVWFDAGRILPPGAYATVMFNLTGFVPTTVAVAFSDAVCADMQNVTTAPVWSVSPTPVQSNALQEDTHDARFVRVRSADGANGELPSWISVARVELCLPYPTSLGP